MKHAIWISVCLLLVGRSSAQAELDVSTPEQLAQARTALYVKALGLDEEMTTAFNNIFLEGEKEAAAHRVACLEAMTSVNRILGTGDRRAMAMLTDEQRGQLKLLRSKGEFDPEMMSCGPAKACCSGDKKAATQPSQRTPVSNSVPELVAPK